MTSQERAALLTRAGIMLYGQRWKTPLAEAMGCNQSSPYRWASGRTHVPDRVFDFISKSLRTRISSLTTMLRMVDAEKNNA